MSLDSGLLYQFVRDAIRPYSEDFRLHDRHNPTTFSLNGFRYSTHVSYVHDSGNSRSNDDEVRIQIGRGHIEVQRQRFNEGFLVAFIGFFDGGKIFIAWDPRHVFSLQAKTIVSVYARQSQVEEVENHQAAVHSFSARLLGETSFAIALPASALGLYLENIEHFHRLPSEESIQRLMQSHVLSFDDSGIGSGGEFDEGEDDRREKFSYERKAYPRDPRFKKWVLDAYDKSCCVCGRQLALVQAAHIIPHSEPECPNSVRNGLAMCIEHHRLYDDALLLPGPGQRLVYNQERADFLTQTGQAIGLDTIKEISRRKYTIPADPDLTPLDDYLQRGLDIRLGN